MPSSFCYVVYRLFPSSKMLLILCATAFIAVPSVFLPTSRFATAQQPYIPERERFEGNSNNVRFERGGGLYSSGAGSSSTTSNSNTGVITNMPAIGGGDGGGGGPQRSGACPADLDFTLHGCICRQATSRGALAIECDGTDAEQVKILLDKARRLRRQIESFKWHSTRNEALTKAGLFDGLVLRHLAITRSKLKTIEPSVFLQLKELETLDLSGNQLVQVPAGALRSLVQLTSLNLADNKIRKLSGTDFETLRSLTLLRLDDNEIAEIERQTFWPLHHLEVLKVDRNNLRCVQEDLFRRSRRLRELSLPSNNMESLHNNALAGLEQSLESLDLSNNKLQRVPETIDQLGRLTTLNLANNVIQFVNATTFSNNVSRSLQSLDLSSNNLTQLPDNNARLAALELLRLNDNRIRVVNSIAFKGMPNLQYLYLRDNQIDKLNDNAFSELPRLRWLYLSGNRLRTLEQEQFGPLKETIEILHVQGNPLVCDCRLKWLEEWMQRDKVADIFETKCHQPRRGESALVATASLPSGSTLDSIRRLNCDKTPRSVNGQLVEQQAQRSSSGETITNSALLCAVMALTAVLWNIAAFGQQQRESSSSTGADNAQNLTESNNNLNFVYIDNNKMVNKNLPRCNSSSARPLAARSVNNECLRPNNPPVMLA